MKVHVLTSFERCQLILLRSSLRSKEQVRSGVGLYGDRSEAGLILMAFNIHCKRLKIVGKRPDPASLLPRSSGRTEGGAKRN